MIVDPPDRRIPYQPWAAALGRKGLHVKTYLDPHGRCALHGPPRNVEVSPIYQLIQPSDENYVVWLLEEVHEYRIIPTDARRHIGRDIKLWGETRLASGRGIPLSLMSSGMSLGLLKFSGGSVDDYAICRSS